MQQIAVDTAVQDRIAADHAVALSAGGGFYVRIDLGSVDGKLPSDLDAVRFACRSQIRFDAAFVLHQELAAQHDRTAAFHHRGFHRHVDHTAVHREGIVDLVADDAVEIHGKGLFRLLRMQEDVQIAALQIDAAGRSFHGDAVHHGQVFALRDESGGVTVAVDGDAGAVRIE